MGGLLADGLVPCSRLRGAASCEQAGAPAAASGRGGTSRVRSGGGSRGKGRTGIRTTAQNPPGSGPQRQLGPTPLLHDAHARPRLRVQSTHRHKEEIKGDEKTGT